MNKNNETPEEKLKEAEELYAESVILCQSKRATEAIPLMEKCLEIRKTYLGDHKDTARVMFLLAVNILGSEHLYGAPLNKEEYSAKHQLVQEAHALLVSTLGTTHHETLTAWSHLIDLRWFGATLKFTGSETEVLEQVALMTEELDNVLQTNGYSACPQLQCHTLLQRTRAVAQWYVNNYGPTHAKTIEANAMLNKLAALVEHNSQPETQLK